MKLSRFSKITFLLLLATLLLVVFFSSANPAPVHANMEPQDLSCEAEWCVCEGYTPAMLEADEKNVTYDWIGDPIGSECVKWFMIWRKYNNSVKEQFLQSAQNSCDSRCRPISAGGDTPTDEPDPMQPPESSCDEEVDRDCDGIPDESDLCPGLPGAQTGDLDCDGVPDDEDLCIGQFGTEQTCGCAETGAAPGDLLFRRGGPAIASVYFPAIVGKATSEGEEYNFGHIGMFAGSFVADQNYPVLHSNGLRVYRQLPGEEQPALISLAKGDTVQPGDIVPDAVLESDLGWGGVGISNMDNFLADNASFSGSTYYGTKVGTPRQRLTCDQRYDVVDILADSARSRANGLEDYDFVTENCANKVSQAYQEGTGYAPWEDFRKPTALLDLWDKQVLTPNMMASFSTLTDIAAERRDTPQVNPMDDPKIAIEGYSPVYIDVYDSQGRHTGLTGSDLEAQIPMSEVWYADIGTKVVNLYAPGGETYDIQLTGYENGSYHLVISGLNLPSKGSSTRIVYPETQIQPGMTAIIHFSADNFAPEAMTMQLDTDGDGVMDQNVVPSMEASTLVLDQENSIEDWSPFYLTGGILLLGVLLFGGSVIILLVGLITKNKIIRNIGILLVSLVICVSLLAATFYFGKKLLVDKPNVVAPPDPVNVVLPSTQASPDDLSPANPPPLQPVEPTRVVIEAPTSTESVPEPSIYNFSTCVELCSGDLSNNQTTFPEKTSLINLRFNYDQIPPGSDYVRLWKNAGQEWVRYHCNWDGPASGVFETSLREPAGLRSGDWTLEIYVANQLIAAETITIQGNYNYWDPAGVKNQCK